LPIAFRALERLTVDRTAHLDEPARRNASLAERMETWSHVARMREGLSASGLFIALLVPVPAAVAPR
jgi:hypothetical protein